MNKLVKAVTILAVMLLAVGLMALPAKASMVNCSTITSCSPSVGTLQTPSASGTLTNGSYTESTYLNSTTGVWTYYFTFTSSAKVTSVSTGLNGPGQGTTAPPETDTFDSSLSYGEVTGSSTYGGTPTFNFSYGPLSTLSVTFSDTAVNPNTNYIPSGETFSFYAQSKFGPGPGTFSSLDGGSYNGSALDPVPEPATASLFGLGLLLLVVGGLCKKRRDTSIQA